MLEDHTMEKKPAGRTLQTPGKGVGTESKKGQDGSTTKVFPKTSRRREPNASPITAKYEQNRKPVPQKSKAIDKRPRPRGQYSGCGKEDSKVVEGQEAEIGSVFLPGSKKQNLNHLLNFHYAPRVSAVPWRSAGGPRWNHGNRSNGIFASSSQRHKYNKEQYLQANCQFVVKANADYSPYASNPDVLVDWDLVEQIRVQGPEVPSCPICLYPPVAAKMTRCGHVYCWPCILHYLALSDKTWRKCPICFEAVHKQDLKSVIALPRVACNIEEEIEMRLMRREKGSLLVTPVEEVGTSAYAAVGPLSVEDTTPASVYSKLLVATPLQVLSIVDREKAELKSQLSDETGCPEICFTEQAIQLLVERENHLIKEGMEMDRSKPTVNENILSPAESITPRKYIPVNETIIYESAFDNTIVTSSEPVINSSIESSDELGNALGKSENKYPEDENSLRCRNESMSSEGLGSEEGITWECSITAEDLELAPSNQYNSSTLCSPNMETMNKYYYFYQAADGQHIYLHSLNVRMLKHGFGSLENCPRLLKGRVLEKEVGSMTLELRKRLRCFQHLPLACQFEVAELALEPPLVSRETLAYFKDQLEYRQRRRQKRHREEQRWEKRAAQEEAQKWGRFPSPHIHLESRHQFPHCGSASSLETFQNDMFPEMSDSEGAKADGYSLSPPSSMAEAFDGLKIDVESPRLMSRSTDNEGIHEPKDRTVESSPPTHESDPGVISFARMLREGKSKVYVSDGKSTKRTDDDGKAAILKAAASKAAVNPRSNRFPGYGSDDSDGERQDCHASAPDFSFGDAIALALKKKENSTEVPVVSQGKKKKKQKQRMLFNTSMGFHGK